MFLGLVACCGITATAQTVPVQIPFLPKYEVLTVVYAPPGSASSVTYGNSSLVGSSNSFVTSNSSTVTESTSTTTGFSLFGFGSSTTTTDNSGWTDAYQNSSSLSVQTTNGNSVTTSGPVSSALGVNHDNDVIYIWLNPVVMASAPNANQSTGPIPLTWSGLEFNSCDLTDIDDPVNAQQAVNGCDPNQYPFPDIVGIPVWCLKNPYYPGQSCAQWLAFTSRPWDISPWGGSTNGTSGTPVAPPPGPMLTLQDYADILQADPFVTQTLVPANTTSGFYCHPTYGVNIDPNDSEMIPSGTTLGNSGKSPISNLAFPVNFCGTPGAQMQRFDPYDTVQYPEPGINGEPQTYSGNFTYTTTSTAGSSSSTTSTQGSSTSTTNSFNAASAIGLASLIPYGGFLQVFGLGFDFSITNTSGYSWTWGQSNATTDTSSTSNSASYSITGPQLSDNYQGPTTFNVYKDNVMGTFAFYSDQQRQSPIILTNTSDSVCGSPVCVEYNGAVISPSSTGLSFGTLAVGASTSKAITIVNNSPHLMTMVAPAVTFSDPAFSITNDNCSNDVLYPVSSGSGYSCTVSVQYLPVISDAPNGSGSPYVVTANLIAAGTENITSYENVLVTSTGIVATGAATPGSATIGTTLLPATSKTTQQPNIYAFAAYGGTTLTQVFNFTSYSSTPFTLPTSPKDIALTDITDFSVTSDTCSNKPFSSVPESCSFTLNYKPQGGPLQTGISVMSLPNTSLGTPSVPLATAAAVAPLAAVTMTVTPSALQTFAGCSDNCGGSSGQPASQTVTVKNTSAYPLSISATAYSGSTYQYSTYTSPGNCTLQPGTSCAITVSVILTNSCGTPMTCTPGNLVITANYGTPPAASVTSTLTIPVSNSYEEVVLRMSGSEQSRQVTAPGQQASASFVIGEADAPAARKVNLPVAGISGVTLTVGGYTYQAHMGGMAILKNQSPASLVAAVINGSQGPVTAQAVGNTVQLTSKVPGTTGNMPFTITSSGSYAASPSSGSLAGGTNPTTTTLYDSGTVTASGGGLSVSASWGQNSTPSTVAQTLAASLAAIAGGKFIATASGSAVTITSLSAELPKVTVTTRSVQGFDPPSFNAAVEQ
jgi:hypothetical protein